MRIFEVVSQAGIKLRDFQRAREEREIQKLTAQTEKDLEDAKSIEVLAKTKEDANLARAMKAQAKERLDVARGKTQDGHKVERIKRGYQKTGDIFRGIEKGYKGLRKFLRADLVK